MTDSLYYVAVYLGSQQLYFIYIVDSLTKTSKGKKKKKNKRCLNVYIDILLSKLEQCMLATATNLTFCNINH